MMITFPPKLKAFIDNIPSQWKENGKKLSPSAYAVQFDGDVSHIQTFGGTDMAQFGESIRRYCYNTNCWGVLVVYISRSWDMSSSIDRERLMEDKEYYSQVKQQFPMQRGITAVLETKAGDVLIRWPIIQQGSFEKLGERQDIEGSGRNTGEMSNFLPPL